MALGSIEARLSALEQIVIIIILGGGGGFPPKGDPLASDQARLEALTRVAGGLSKAQVDPATVDLTRLEALYSIFGNRPNVDPYSPDIARLSAVELESAVHRVNAELVRLKALEAQMQERLKEAKGKPGAG